MRERELLRWIAGRVPHAGDDCAALAVPEWGYLLVTVDSVIDGVHAHWEEHGPRAFGYKAVARGLSDIAAMGGEPLWAVLATTLPAGTTDEQAKEILRGAESTGCEMVGGDIASGAVASVSATVLGRAAEPVRRDGARVGDRLVVSGPLGRSYPSGWHLAFEPRVAEAQALRGAVDVHAMIDLSDGLGSDLHTLCEASGVGAELRGDAIPRRDGATLAQALGDGEDYELLAAVTAEGSLPTGFVEIGHVVESGIRLDGAELPRSGYEHRA